MRSARRLTPRRVVALSVAAVAASAGGVAAASLPSGDAARRPAKVGLRTTDLGRVLVDRAGRTLYLFEKDVNGRSRCYGDCARAWPPVTTTGAPVAGAGVSAAKLGTVLRRTGTRQVTYNGHPLYRFAGDHAPGDTTGQRSNAYGARWYVLGASGRRITRSTPLPGYGY